MKYEEAAELVTVAGYQCKTCRAFYQYDTASSKHAAQWCCATDLPCECGKRITNKHRAYCEECIIVRDCRRWEDMPQEDWNGEDVLAIWDGDKFFFDASEILDYIESVNDNREDDDEEIDIDDLRIVICERATPSGFSFADYFYDDLADGNQDDDYSDIDARVNAILRERFPETWRPTNVRASRKSIYRWCHGSAEQAA